ncbi:hypothetical protein [Streptomyces sp. NPDC005423]|uniref:hypothetical protein n=1 Tax=Streptomyces sp. NPDC005423 TaxID=3155343 RepID=UPI0033B5A187
MPKKAASSCAEQTGSDRLTRNNGPLGTAVPPKRIKPAELDDNGDIRVNPFFVPLGDIPREVILDGKPGAVWHFSAVLREDVNEPGVLRWGVTLGSEELLTAMGRMDFLKVLGGLRKGALKQQEENPGEEIKYPTQEDLKRNIDGLGHPTIAVDFKINGTTKSGDAAVSGEFRYDRNRNLGTANDKSGRYMSEKARPEKKDRDPEKIADWGRMVAEKFGEHLRVPVVFEQIKTVANPIAGQAMLLQPPRADPAPPAAPRAQPAQASSSNNVTRRSR